MNTTNFKPKKSSLISNLLNRVDDSSVGVTRVGKTGIQFNWYQNTERHTKANKASLKDLSYEQLESLLTSKTETVINPDKAFTDYDFEVPQPKIVRKEAIIVPSLKQIDKQGSSKFSDDDSNTGKQKVKTSILRKRI